MGLYGDACIKGSDQWIRVTCFVEKQASSARHPIIDSSVLVKVAFFLFPFEVSFLKTLLK